MPGRKGERGPKGGRNKIIIDQPQFHFTKRVIVHVHKKLFTVEQLQFFLNQRTVNQVIQQHRDVTIDVNEIHVNQRTVKQTVNQYRSVQIDHQENFGLEYSKIAALERRIAVLEAR